MLVGPGQSTRILYHALKNDLRIEKVIIEERVSRYKFLKRRAKKLGYWTVLGQVLFRLIVVPCLKAGSMKRVKEIKDHYGLTDSDIPESVTCRVASVNADETIAILKEINPDVVIVNGTRIISRNVLNSVPAKFINVHAGITPLYRGVHGAYWAIVQGDIKACGVTVHLVDARIDTGDVLEQAVIPFGKEDNFTTYPMLQLAVGIPLLKKAVRDALEDRIELKSGAEGVSRIWTHPTLWEYLRWRLSRGVK